MAMLARLFVYTIVMLAMIAPVKAQSAEQFYKGSSITIVVGTGTGGNFDVQARIAARHWGRFIPGSPTIVVQNMPGAGGIVAANRIYNTAPQDGSVIGLISGTAMLEPLFGAASVQFDPRKFAWIGGGSVKLPGSCFVWHTSAIQTAQDLFEKEVVIGSTTGNTNLVFPVALKEVLGAKMKIVRGYHSTNEVLLAMERREVEGTCGLAWAGILNSRSQWITGKRVRLVLLTYAVADPTWPKDVPNALEFAKSPQDRQVLEVIFGATDIQRPFMAPPGVPRERVEILRKAYLAMIRDAAFNDSIEKAGLDFRALSSSDIESTISLMYRTPKDLIGRAAVIFSQSK